MVGLSLVSEIHFVVGQESYNTSEFVPPRVTEAGVARSRIGLDNKRGVGGSCPWRQFNHHRPDALQLPIVIDSLRTIS